MSVWWDLYGLEQTFRGKIVLLNHIEISGDLPVIEDCFVKRILEKL